MAETFTKLAQVTLGADYANVNFTSISQNYTHLLLTVAARGDTVSYYNNAFIKLNNITTSYYGITMETGSSTPTVFNDSTGNAGLRFDFPSGGTTSSNQFGVAEVWFHNYTSGSHKGGTAEMYVGNQTSSTFIDRRAWHWSNTAAISSMYITAASGKFKTNSTFTLYGIGQLGSANTGIASVATS